MDHEKIKINNHHDSPLYSRIYPEITLNSMPLWTKPLQREDEDFASPDTLMRTYCGRIYDSIYEFIHKYLVWMIFSLCIVLGPLNFVLYKMLYTAYGDHGAYFVSQSINLLYVVFGAAVLRYCSMNEEIDQETLNAPHINFIIMGFLDCFAGFLSAMGAYNVPGAAQQLLNQSLIPWTMLASYCFLGMKSTYLQIFGAINILVGSFLVVLPKLPYNTLSLSESSTYDSYHVISAFIYFCSNIPFASSYVFKEYGFKNLAVHVIYLTQWVSIYQLLFGFLLAPFQLLPGMGSPDGMTVFEIVSNFQDGIECFFEYDIECREKQTFLLLIGYCIVNFTFNTTGLYLVKHGSATLNAISYAIILPITTLAFALPILGRYQESFDVSTIIGLIVVLLGFFLWKGESIAGDVLERKRQSLLSRAMNLRRYKRISRDIDSSSPATSSDGFFGDLEFERPSFEKIDDDSMDFDLAYYPTHDQGNEYHHDSYQNGHHQTSAIIASPKSKLTYMQALDPIISPPHRNHVESFNERVIVAGIL